MNGYGAIVISITPGIYEHYKGSRYEVFRVVKHSETEEDMVLYRCLYGDYSWWVRPLTMFTETVIVNDESLPRFVLIDAKTRSTIEGHTE